MLCSSGSKRRRQGRNTTMREGGGSVKCNEEIHNTGREGKQRGRVYFKIISSHFIRVCCWDFAMYNILCRS